jgi:hypothetical protein
LTPQWGFSDAVVYTKTFSKTKNPKPNFFRLSIQVAMGMAGHGEGNFWVK